MCYEPPGMADEPKPKDAWDRADIIGKLLGSILIPVTLALAGYFVNAALQDRAAKQKTLEIAVSVLQSKDTTTPELKAWARDVFNGALAEAGQKLTPAAQKELETKPLPTGDRGTGAGVDLVAEFEGVSLKPYKDPTGVWTIGYGHTRGVTEHTPPITIEEAREFLVTDLQRYNQVIDRLVKVPLTNNQRSALVSFVWNAGAANFESSGILKAVNEKRYGDVPAELRKYVRVGGNILKGLVARREREVEIWNRKDEN